MNAFRSSANQRSTVLLVPLLSVNLFQTTDPGSFQNRNKASPFSSSSPYQAHEATKSPLKQKKRALLGAPTSLPKQLMAKPISIEVWNPSGKYRVVSTKPMPGTRWIRLLTDQNCRVEVKSILFLLSEAGLSFLYHFSFKLPALRFAPRRRPSCPWRIFSRSSATNATASSARQVHPIPNTGSEEN